MTVSGMIKTRAERTYADQSTHVAVIQVFFKVKCRDANTRGREICRGTEGGGLLVNSNDISALVSASSFEKGGGTNLWAGSPSGGAGPPYVVTTVAVALEITLSKNT